MNNLLAQSNYFADTNTENFVFIPKQVAWNFKLDGNQIIHTGNALCEIDPSSVHYPQILFPVYKSAQFSVSVPQVIMAYQMQIGVVSFSIIPHQQSAYFLEVSIPINIGV